MNYVEFKNWLSKDEQHDVTRDVVVPAKWRFGQVSDDYTLYPMWLQAFWKTQDYTYTPDCVPIAKSLTDRFIDEIVPDDYILVRSMASANSFGQDGDIHTDWPRAEESITGVVYTTTKWEPQFGGETLIYNADEKYADTVLYETSKLITFDSSLPHIGKGPQRRCGDIRTIIAFQAVQQDAWKRALEEKKKKKVELSK